METLFTLSLGIGLTLGTVGLYLLWTRRKDRHTKAALEQSELAGLNEPPSLHPVIDPDLCIGSAACVASCPEHEILGTVDGKARLVHAARCIGHGRCFHACPVEAITLVFGTARRGVDIPHVSRHFETNVPGLYVAGELGGMGLIRNAVTQGHQAMSHIVETGDRGGGDVLDVLIVGAGPAGLSASLEAVRSGLRFETVDQEGIGGAIRHYPRRKLVMTQPMDIPLYGKVRERQMLKEELVDLWNRILERTGLEVHTGLKVSDVQKHDGVFRVTAGEQTWLSRQVVLAIGRRGSPRKLGVPGEDLAKVSYSLLEPEQFQEMNVLVVGGGDSALEAACSLAEEPGTRVTLSYRGEQFRRPKENVRDRLESLAGAGRLEILLASNVVRIEEAAVQLDCGGEVREFPNDQVFIFAGGELPTGFLKQIGVSVDTRFGERRETA